MLGADMFWVLYELVTITVHVMGKGCYKFIFSSSPTTLQGIKKSSNKTWENVTPKNKYTNFID